MTDELVSIGNFESRLEAELVMRRLQAAGIEAAVSTDSAGGMVPSMSAMGPGPAVLIRAEDLTAARDVLSEPGEPLDAD